MFSHVFKTEIMQLCGVNLSALIPSASKDAVSLIAVSMGYYTSLSAYKF